MVTATHDPTGIWSSDSDSAKGSESACVAEYRAPPGRYIMCPM